MKRICDANDNREDCHKDGTVTTVRCQGSRTKMGEFILVMRSKPTNGAENSPINLVKPLKYQTEPHANHHVITVCVQVGEGNECTGDT